MERLPMLRNAPEMLQEASSILSERASTRDNEQLAERSMKACVDAFNAMYGTQLTEEQGWLFMVFLKISRSRYGALNMDDYIDGSAYFALAGEAASQARHSTAP
jgi:hypothetical protein